MQKKIEFLYSNKRMKQSNRSYAMPFYFANAILHIDSEHIITLTFPCNSTLFQTRHLFRYNCNVLLTSDRSSIAYHLKCIRCSFNADSKHYTASLYITWAMFKYQLLKKLLHIKFNILQYNILHQLLKYRNNIPNLVYLDPQEN